LWPSDDEIKTEALDDDCVYEAGFESGAKWLKNYCKEKGYSLIKKK
jgi:hypothetical protein